MYSRYTSILELFCRRQTVNRIFCDGAFTTFCHLFISTSAEPILLFTYLLQAIQQWSSLVEGDEQLDRPNSQTTTELCHACVLHNFFSFNIITTSFCLGRSSLHHLLLKSSMAELLLTSKELQGSMQFFHQSSPIPAFSIPAEKSQRLKDLGKIALAFNQEMGTEETELRLRR